jgi:hypothetical protein
MRFTGEVTWKTVGDAQQAAAYRPTARLLVGQTLTTLGPGVDTYTRRVRLNDGTLITVQLLPQQQPIVTIDVATGRPAQRRQVLEASIWIPRGFVVLPINSANRAGWGLPIVQEFDPAFSEDLQTFAPGNLAPGLDVARWTPGGPLAQVLITRDRDGGYPVEPNTRSRTYVDVSPNYHPRFGPFPAVLDVPTGPWGAYRLEFNDFELQSLRTDVDPQTVKDSKREMFNLLNGHRASVGRPPLNPPLRGSFDSAQVACEASWETRLYGHMVGGFPSTYKTYNARSAKNGWLCEEDGGTSEFSMVERVAMYGSEILVGFADEYESLGLDLNGWPVLRLVGTRYQITPTFALAGWLSSTRHRAVIESPIYDDKPAQATTTHLGFRPGTVAAVFERNQQWIQCGNRYWLSQHPEVPPLSWKSFDTLNLLWETMPVALQAGLPVSGGGLRAAFTFYFNEPQDWLDETTIGTDPPGEEVPFTFNRDAQVLRQLAGGQINYRTPLGGELYMRGRCIAIAPDSGFVLGAGVARLNFDNRTVWRLIVIAHHREDQPAETLPEVFTLSTPVPEFTARCRLWWTDFENDPAVAPDEQGSRVILPCHPRTVVRKVFGREEGSDGPHPSIEFGPESTWRGGELLDVSRTGLAYLLKYDCLWTFDPPGLQAACIRSGFYASEFDTWSFSTDPLNQQSTWVRTAEPSLLSPIWEEGAGSISITNKRFNFIPGGDPIYCRLQLTHQQNSVSASLTFEHFAGELNAAEPAEDYVFSANPPRLHQQWAADNYAGCAPRVLRPVAVYWRGSALRALYDVSIIEPTTRMNTIDRGPPVVTTLAFPDLDLACVGRGLVRGPAMLDAETARGLVYDAELYSSDIAQHDVDIAALWASVYHVSDDHLAYAVVGARTPFYFDESPTFGASWCGGRDLLVRRFPGYDAPDPEDTRYEDTYFEDFCDWAPTTRETIAVRVVHNGIAVVDTNLPNPGGHYTFPRGLWATASTIFGGLCPRNASPYSSGNLCVDRAGNWLLAVTFGAQPGGFPKRMTTPAASAGPFSCSTGGTLVVPIIGLGARFSQNGEPCNVAGHWSSSFADLGELTETPGESWSVYVRLV